MQSRQTNRDIDSQPAFVLVHGAWHGGWCWQRVADRLIARGHRVFAPSLTGLADKKHILHPGITLEDHIEEVVALVEHKGLKCIVLCGHSYGGMVITGAAERLQSHLHAVVYLDAFIPKAGQSLNDLSGPEARAKREAIVAQVGTGYLPPISAEYMRVNDGDRAWVDSQCTDHPFQTFKDSLPSVDAHERVGRKIYVRATQMPAPAYDLIARERRTRPDWDVIDLPFGHDLMVDAPDAVAEILLGTLDGPDPDGRAAEKSGQAI